MKTGTLERELTQHLERAHELGERAKESNDALVEQLRRAGEIAEELKSRIVFSRMTSADDGRPTFRVYRTQDR